MKAHDWTRSAVDKVTWGTRAVGLIAVARGVLRTVVLRLRRPVMSSIRLRSGGRLTFAYPSQYAPALVLFGDLIDPEYAFLRRICRREWVVIDVGAAIGQFAIFVAHQTGASVHAFEPIDANLETLRTNIDINDVSDRINVHRVALSSAAGNTSFAPTERTFLSRLDETESPGDRADVARVPVRRLDGEAASLDIDHVNVLKVNVAGGEPAVLDGATDLLEQRRVDVLVLLLGVDSFPWYERLHELGYEIGFYHHREGVFYSAEHTDERILDERPWPARHVIAIRRQAITNGALGPVRVVTRR